jgi:hypothetical protein
MTKILLFFVIVKPLLSTTESHNIGKRSFWRYFHNSHLGDAQHHRGEKNKNIIQNLPFSDDPHFPEWTQNSKKILNV